MVIGPAAIALNAGVVENVLWVTRTRTSKSDSDWSRSINPYLVSCPPLPEAGPGSESVKSMITAETVLGGVLGSLSLCTGAGISVAIPKFILPFIGFGITGITKGSIAALIHSSIGNVTAGSFFALMQSAGAVGAISWTTFAGITFLGTAAVVTVAMAAVAVCYRWWPAR